MATVRQEQNDVVEAMQNSETPQSSAPPVRGMGGAAAKSSANVKGLPDRSASSTPAAVPRPRGRGQKGNVADLLAIFGQAGVANINVRSEA